MYNNPFYMPGYNIPMASPNFLRGAATPAARAFSGAAPAARAFSGAARGAGAAGGLLSRLGTGFSGIRAINWGNLINTTSKTLGIINQAIPMVRQVGPMVNNMRSMLRVASLFKDETDVKRTPDNNDKNTTNSTTNHQSTRTSNTNTNYQNNQSTPISNLSTTTSKTNNSKNSHEEYGEAPTFFINT